MRYSYEVVHSPFKGDRSGKSLVIYGMHFIWQGNYVKLGQIGTAYWMLLFRLCVSMKRVALDFTDLQIYPSFIVGRTHEGICVDLEKHQKVLDVVASEIDGPYGFIIDEVNDYSVSFEVMLHMKKDPSIACGAIVAYRNRTLKALACAVDFIGKPTKVFKNLEDAKAWVGCYMDEYNQMGVG